MKILNKLKPVTPTELFKQQVNNVIASAKAEGDDTISIPVQFGGLFGQRVTLEEDIVVNVISIDGT